MMTETILPPNETECEQQEASVVQRLELENKHKSGANWFFWIAALSVVNSVIVFAGGEWSFIVGLGLTQIIDGVARGLAAEGGPSLQLLALTLSVLVAGVFVFFGVMARKRHGWAFVVGMILYAFDGLLFLVVLDVLSIAFHAFALWCLYSGLKACNELKKQTGPAGQHSPAQQPWEKPRHDERAGVS